MATKNLKEAIGAMSWYLSSHGLLPRERDERCTGARDFEILIAAATGERYYRGYHKSTGVGFRFAEKVMGRSCLGVEDLALMVEIAGNGRSLSDLALEIAAVWNDQRQGVYLSEEQVGKMLAIALEHRRIVEIRKHLMQQNIGGADVPGQIRNADLSLTGHREVSQKALERLCFDGSSRAWPVAFLSPLEVYYVLLTQKWYVLINYNETLPPVTLRSGGRFGWLGQETHRFE